MALTEHEIVALIKELFRRVSSDGKEPISPCCTDDLIYDSPYENGYLIGAKNIDLFFRELIPKFLNPLRQWPVAIYPTADGEMVPIEYESRCTAVHDGSLYENRYAGIFKLRGDKICFWREYYNVEWFNRAVGPGFGETWTSIMPPGGLGIKRKEDREGAHIDQWTSRFVLPEFRSGSPW